MYSSVYCLTVFRKANLLSTIQSAQPAEQKQPAKRFQKILVPPAELELNFIKSSGPGGQNVNKRSTKAEIRFNLFTASWLSDEAKAKFQEIHPTRINKDGFVIVSCQRYRTQPENERSCLHLIQGFVDDVSFQLAGLPTRGERRQARAQKSKAKNRSRALKKIKDRQGALDEAAPL